MVRVTAEYEASRRALQQSPSNRAGQEAGLDQPVPPLPQSPSNRAGQKAGLDVGDSGAAATAASTAPPLRHDPPKAERDRLQHQQRTASPEAADSDTAPGTAAAGGAAGPVSTARDEFTMEDAVILRRTTQGCHNQMRALLISLAEDAEETPTTGDPNQPRQVAFPALAPWRHYLAHHKEWKGIIGPGVVSMYGQFRSRTDANHGSQLRLDFVVQRSDGVVATLHPGRVPRLDARVHFYDPGTFHP